MRPRLKRALLAAGLAVLLFVAAFVPRALVVPTMVTADEDSWLGLASNFAAALEAGQDARTYQIGHPGVTVFWVDILGLGLDRAAQQAGLVEFQGNVATRRLIAESPDFLPALAAARWAHALVNAGLVAVVGLLVWRLLGRGIGLVAGLLLAFDPFLVAYGQVTRMDSLQALLLALALLAALIRFLRQGHWLFVLLSGVAFGLALLSKSSSILFGPIIVGAALVGLWLRPDGGGQTWRRLLARLTLDGLVWVGVTAATCAGLWPALRVAPEATLRAVLEFAAANSSAPPEAGNYFFGSVVDDPGPWFYPVALLFRATPLACLGLVLLAVVWRVRRRPGARAVVLGILALSAVLLTIFLGEATKKFDRYALPVVPLLLILAAAGLCQVSRFRGPRRRLLLATIGAASLPQLAALPPLSPYPLAYYNPLLGGPSVAQQVMLVGWGEGLELAAARLNQLPDADDQVVAAFHEDALGANLVGTAVPLERFAEADYVVIPIDAQQRRVAPPELSAALHGLSPDDVIPLMGIEYARVFRLPRPVFADSLRLERYTVHDSTLSLGQRVRLDTAWRPLSVEGVGARPVFRLLDTDGIAAGTPAPVQGDANQVGSIGEQIEETVALDSPKRAGRYRLAVSVLSPDGRVLPVSDRPPWTRLTGDELVLPTVSVRYR